MTTPEQIENAATVETSALAMRSPLGELPLGAAITLYEGPLVIHDQETSVAGQGEVTFEFVPELSVQFTMKPEPGVVAVSNSRDASASREESSIELVTSGRTVTAMVLETNQSWPSGASSMSGILTGAIQFSTMKAEENTPESIGRVRFHLLNFHNFHGENLCIAQGEGQKQWRGRAQFEFDKWVVTLDALPDIRERHKQIKARGGYAITHIGDLRRKDGKLFEAQDAGDMLDFLHWFLSFVNGARCGCVLASGLRYLDYPLWEDWSPQITGSSKNGQSWLARDHTKACLAIANKFYSFWRDSDKRNWLTLAVSIYTDSNHNESGTELELTKSQIALEMLCWVVLREEKAIISDEGLEKLPAADRIRLLLSVSGIPLPIPNALTNLKKAFEKAAGVDGPLATTEIRNSVVHPTKKNRDKLHNFSDMTKFEAWQLNMWYVELALLKLFGYTGRYDNRLDLGGWAGSSESVPWALSSS